MMRRSGFILLALTAGAAAQPAPPAALLGASWELVALRAGAEVARPAEAGSFTLSFDAERNVVARLDCNRGRGTFTATPDGADRGTLQFGPMAVTRAMCPPGSLDGRVMRELQTVRYAIEGGTLRLEVAGGGQQLWRRAP